MSFCIWNERPPFEFGEDDREQIYAVGDKFVVTDNPTLATKEGVDAALNPAPQFEPITVIDLLLAKNLITKAEAEQFK